MSARAVALSAAVAIAGCQQLPPERARTADCIVRSDAEETFATGLAQACSDFRASIDRDLGLRRGDARPVEMTVWRDRSTIAGICGPDAEACAVAPTTHANAPLHLHELVHAHLGLLSQPPLFFAEGIADVLGRQISPAPRQSFPLAWLGGDAAFRGAGVAAYADAGAFVRWLIVRFGGPAFGALYLAMNGVRDLPSLDVLSTSVLGVSLSVLHAEWTAMPSMPPASFGTFECGRPALGTGRSELVIVRGVVPPDTFAVRHIEDRAIYDRGGVLAVVELDAATVVHVEASAPTVLVGPCDDPAAWTGTSAADGDVDHHVADPGRYYVWVEATVPTGAGDAPVIVELRAP